MGEAELNESTFVDDKFYWARQDRVDDLEKRLHLRIVLRGSQSGWPDLFLEERLNLRPVLFDEQLRLAVEDLLSRIAS